MRRGFRADRRVGVLVGFAELCARAGDAVRGVLGNGAAEVLVHHEKGGVPVSCRVIATFCSQRVLAGGGFQLGLSLGGGEGRCMLVLLRRGSLRLGIGARRLSSSRLGARQRRRHLQR